MIIRTVFLLAACLALAACAGAPGGAVLAGLDAPDAATAISRYRAANGLGAVRADPGLTRAARVQAEAMARASTLSHDIAGDFGGRIRAAGAARAVAAENLGMGYTSFGAAMTGWNNSSGHRQNLLLPEATRIGVASARNAGGRLYWALILAAGPEERRQTPDAGPIVRLPFGGGLRVAR